MVNVIAYYYTLGGRTESSMDNIIDIGYVENWPGSSNEEVSITFYKKANNNRIPCNITKIVNGKDVEWGEDYGFKSVVASYDGENTVSVECYYYTQREGGLKVLVFEFPYFDLVNSYSNYLHATVGDDHVRMIEVQF